MKLSNPDKESLTLQLKALLAKRSETRAKVTEFEQSAATHAGEANRLDAPGDILEIEGLKKVEELRTRAAIARRQAEKLAGYLISSRVELWQITENFRTAVFEAFCREVRGRFSEKLARKLDGIIHPQFMDRAIGMTELFGRVDALASTVPDFYARHEFEGDPNCDRWSERMLATLGAIQKLAAEEA